jgi:hypothetical protein
MSLDQELCVGSKQLYTDRINDALRNHNVEEIAQFIRDSENIDEFYLNCPPVNEELGRHISDAIVQNSHIRTLYIDNYYGAIWDLVAWIGSRNTLVNMTSLRFVTIQDRRDMSALDSSMLFPLLLTITSLHSFEINFRCDNGCSDDVMSALSSYLGTAALTKFEFFSTRLLEAAFTALCNGVALSTLRQFSLYLTNYRKFNLETAAESIALMIVESSLEEVWMEEWSESFISALKLTAPVRNMDFAFTQIWYGSYTIRLRINRKWKPLVFHANTPLALWPHILDKSHASPETSHASADIVYYVLRQKPNLVPAP